MAREDQRPGPRLQTANEFVIKNLFIIPFTTLYLLVAVKVTLRL